MGKLKSLKFIHWEALSTPCINFQHYHLGIIMLFAMQNKKSSHICLVFQPDMMESQNKVSDCKQASWTLFISVDV